MARKKSETVNKQNESIMKINLETFRRLIANDILNNTKLIESETIGCYKISDISFALKNPRNNWRLLLGVSEELMHISPHYYRLNNFFSNMALFCWGIDLYDVKENQNVDNIKRTYMTLAAKLEGMNIKHEFYKIMKTLPYQDIFCGLIIDNQNDFFIQKINFNVCKLYQIQDGLYNFKIDLSAIKITEIDAYPSYVREAYFDFIDNTEKKNVSRWYMPSPDRQICIKLNSQWTYPYPMLIGMIKDIFDIDTYKKLKLQSARTDNYKAILVEVPIDKNTVDKPLITPETLGLFAEINKENMTDDIGLIYNLGSKGEAVSFKDSSNSRNNVADANDNIYDSSGVTKELFNGSASGTAVTFSIENDAGFIYGLYRQFERWVNRWIKIKKYNKSGYKFSFYLLDITIFNRDTVSKRYKDACTLGATVVDKWLASIEMTPSKMMGSYILHENIFDYTSHFKPLSSSYNGASNTGNEGGRPTNASKGELLSDEGEKTANGEKNDS